MAHVSSEKKVRRRFRQQAAWGRLALLAMLAATLCNQLLLASGIEYHLLFSAAAPYYLNWVCRELRLTGSFSAAAAVLTAAQYGAYFTFWALSKRNRHWLAAALGLYAVDTLLLLFFALTLLKTAVSCALELLCHGICICILLMAIHAAGQLSRIPQRRRTAHSL